MGKQGSGKGVKVKKRERTWRGVLEKSERRYGCFENVERKLRCVNYGRERCIW